MTATNRVIIFGLGGVGSHLAYMMTRYNSEFSKFADGHRFEVDENKLNELILVDYDNVEEKNLKRQLFTQTNIGQRKVEAFRLNFESSVYKTLVDGTLLTSYETLKITDSVDLLRFDRQNDLALICVDDLRIKNLIADSFERKLIINCDSDYYEIKGEADDEDRSAWQFMGENGAYTSDQNFSSNIMSAFHVYRLLLEHSIRGRFGDIYFKTQVRELVDDWDVKGREVIETKPMDNPKITDGITIHPLGSSNTFG